MAGRAPAGTGVATARAPGSAGAGSTAGTAGWCREATGRCGSGPATASGAIDRPRVRSIEADAGVPNDLDPLVVFSGEERLELFRRQVDDLAAVLLEARGEFRQRLRDRLLQAGDHGRRRL